MQANLENLGQLERRLNLALPLQQIESEVESRLKRLARTVKVHGFRPGKVPIKIVAQQYGSQVRQEVLGDALQKRFGEAVQEQKLRVAGYPRFEAKTSETAQFEFSATFEVYPDVNVGDLSGQSIERPDIKVSPQDVDKTIEILCKQRVQFQPVERAAASGDQVSVDYNGKLGGVEFAGGQAKNHTLVLGEGRVLKDFEDAIAGMLVGESKTFELTFPEDYYGKEMAGKTVSFTLALNTVAEPLLPEINAEFAQSLGVADGSVEKMRNEVTGNLEREVAKRVQAKVKDQVMQALLDTTKMDVPKALIDVEAERLMQQARNDLETRGMNKSDVPLPADIFEQQARRRVSLGLILAELVRSHQLIAKPEQVRALVDQQAQSYEHPDQVVKWYYEQPQRLQEVESIALEDNVVAWVLEHAKVTDKSVSFDELMGNA